MYFWTVIYFWWFVLFLHYSIRFALLSVCTVMALLQCGSTIEPKLGQNDQTVTLQGQCGFLSFFSEHLLLQSWRQHSKALFFFFKCLYFGIKCLICLDCCLVVFFLCVFCMLLRWHWLLRCEIFISVPMWKDIFKLFEWIKNGGKSVVCEFLCFSCLKIVVSEEAAGLVKTSSRQHWNASHLWCRVQWKMWIKSRFLCLFLSIHSLHR